MADDGDAQPGDIRFLDVEDIIYINRALITAYTPKEQCGVADRKLLEGAQMRPSTYRYYQQTNDLLMLSAVLFVAIAKAHAFHNANKRTAFAACRIFLLINGAQFDPPMDQTLEVATGIATDEYEIDQVASWISWYTRPIDCAAHLSALQETVDVLAEWPTNDD